MSNHNPAADDVYVEDSKRANPVEENLKSSATWMRCLFMLISGVLASVTLIAGSVIVLLGFCWVLFTGEVNRDIRGVGQSVATYLYNIARYLTFNTDEKPFPLGGAWPAPDGE